MANNSIKDLLEEARLRADISKNLTGYLEGIEKLKTYQKTINDNVKYYAKLTQQQNEARARGEQDVVNKIEEQLKYIREQNEEYDRQIGMLKLAVKEANKYQMALIATGKAGINGLAKLPGLVQQNWGKLKGFGLFEMEKAVKNSALQMGLLGKEGKSYSQSIRKTAADTNEIGVGIEALAKMQGQYTEDLGRSVMLGDKGLKAMAAMSVATGLGAEGTGELAANMDEIGISAERTGDYINQTMNDAHKMGLNASKVVKNIAGNIKMLNKYHFKDGIKGLAKMAELSAKLGIKMDFASGMADKMWDIEGAVDMSAQLQVMGGAWAKLSDPFHLMYMAREDAAGLTEEIAKASQASMHFAKDGSIEMSSMEMSRLKIIAEKTGLEYDDLVKSGKEMFKLNKVSSQIKLPGVDDDMKEFIANAAQLDKNGKATIEIDGDTKLVSQMTDADKKWVKMQVGLKESMADRAKAAQNFDDKITNLINQIKTYMLPIVDGINETLGPIVDEFMKNKDWKKDLIQFGKNIGNFITKLKPVFETVGSIIKFLGPTGTLAVLFGGKLFFDLAKWFLNGLSLASGFLSGTKGFMGTSGMSGASSSWSPGQTGPTANAAFGMSTQAGVGANFSAGLSSKMLKLGGVAAGLLSAYNEYSENKAKGMGTGENLGRSGLKGVGAGGGAWAGAAAGAAIGTLAGPIGTLVGGAIGGALGAWGGGALGEGAGNLAYGAKVNDAQFSVVGGGKITPIDTEDDFYALKPGGAASKGSQSQPTKMEIEHSPLEVKGTIKLELPNGVNQNIDFMKDAHNLRAVTSLVHAETARMLNGTQKA